MKYQFLIAFVFIGFVFQAQPIKVEVVETGATRNEKISSHLLTEPLEDAWLEAQPKLVNFWPTVMSVSHHANTVPISSPHHTR